MLRPSAHRTARGRTRKVLAAGIAFAVTTALGVGVAPGADVSLPATRDDTTPDVDPAPLRHALQWT